MNQTSMPLRVLYFASFLQYQRFIMPISFLFYLHNGLNFSDFILFQSIFNITCLAAKIPMGFLGDLFSKKFLIIVSYLMFLLRVVLWICFRGFWIILAGEILYGLFKALFRGNVDSYIYEWLKQNNISQKMLPKYGKLSFYTSLGSAVSCIAGVVLYKYYGFQSLLYLELIMQIFAVVLLFFLPNITSAEDKIKSGQYLKSISESILSTIKNPNINYYVYYSAMLTGLTSIFVWNFQPLLKLASAPIILFGIVSFVNQCFRAFAGLFAQQAASFLKNIMFKIEYFAVLISFILIILAHQIKNYITTSFFILLICISIFLFVIFNIYTVTKIHENTPDNKRATTSSTNTFFGDFAAFALLLIFKLLFDQYGFYTTITIFIICSAIILYPYKKFTNT